MSFIPADLPHSEWVKIGMGLKHELGDDGYSLWIAWSSKAQNFDKSAADASWRSFKNGGGITIATVFYYAKQYGYTRDAQSRLTDEEIERRRIEKEQRRRAYEQQLEQKRKGQQNVADNAAELYHNLPTLGEHPYLSQKRCGAYGLKIWNESIFIPILNVMTDKIQSYQTISCDNYITKKMFAANGVISEGYFSIPYGIIGCSNLGTVCVCEGYATAATVYEATGYTSVVTFNCGNMKKVLAGLTRRFPQTKFIVCADNDCHHADGRNPGLEAAREAIKFAGRGLLAYPRFTGEQMQSFKNQNIKPTDFNDLLQLGYSGGDISTMINNAEPVIADNIDPIDAQNAMTAMEKFKKPGEDEYKNSFISIKTALSFKSIAHCEYAWDDFKSLWLCRKDNHPDWVPIDEDLIFAEANSNLETFGIPKPSMDLIRSAVFAVAKENRFDSCMDWILDNLPAWDGVSRIENFFLTYVNARNEAYSDDYVKEVGRYLFTAMYARATAAVYEVKADIVPLLIGAQGLGKSTLVSVLAPLPSWYGTLDLADKNEDMFRKMQGKVIIEFPEISGADKKTKEAIKSFITKSSDEWVQKYKEQSITKNRRCVFIMTTNDSTPLNDTTGNRRYAPLVISKRIDFEPIKRDLLQLWAEAQYLYEHNGVMFGALEAETAKCNVHDSFTRELSCESEILSFAEKKTYGGYGFRMCDLMMEVYQMSLDIVEKSQSLQRSIGDFLRRYGYVKKRVSIAANSRKYEMLWYRA